MAVRPGDPDLYVAEKTGRVVAIHDGTVLGRPVLDLTGQVSSGSEQGLLGIVFSPDGHFLYVNLTDTNGNTRVLSFSMGAHVADAASRRDVLEVDQPFANHNGGDLAFGPDGYLYIGLGDGGSEGDPNGNGQSLTTLLAKMLRIAPKTSGAVPYTIPPDNPFVGKSNVRPEIWAYGLRNPWRYSSPDGRSLALTLSGEGLAILDVATGTHRIVDGARVAGPVAWSPDGRTIAFTTISYGPYQLHSGVVAYDAGTGRSRVLLAPRSTLGVYGLSWSPDSRAVAVLYLPIHPQLQGLLTVSRNGSEIRAIAVCGDTAAGDGSCPSGNVVAWSPDGDHLLVEDFTFGGAGPSLLVLTPGGTTTRVSGSLLPAWGLGWSPA